MKRRLYAEDYVNNLKRENKKLRQQKADDELINDDPELTIALVLNSFMDVTYEFLTEKDLHDESGAYFKDDFFENVKKQILEIKEERTNND